MKIRRRNLLLVGLGALVGLCAPGCQNGQLQPSGLLQVMSRRPTQERVELVAPRGESRMAASTPASPAASIASPIIRTAAQEVLPAGPVTASSWRAQQRPPEPESLDLAPAPVPVPRSIVSRVTTEPEKLGAPRPVGAPVRSQVVMHDSPVVHGGVHVGHHHGVLHGPGDVPREGQKAPLPPYVIEPPDILLIQLIWRDDPKILPQPVDGQFIVRPDGTVNIGVYGTVQLAGKTIDEARKDIENLIDKRVKIVTDDEGKPLPAGKRKGDVAVDVLEFASKYCYMIASGGGHGETVIRIPINGSDTVLDIVGKVGGLPQQASLKKIWLARANLGHPGEQYVLPIDWAGISKRAMVATNYQIFPGDRIYVNADPLIQLDSKIGKVTNPIDRLFGTVLLGSTTVNSFKNNRNNNNNNR